MKKLSLKEMFQNMFKNMGMKNIILVVCFGLLLLVISLPSKNQPGTSLVSDSNEDGTFTEDINQYEKNMEKRLENILSNIQGAGKVKVMITYKESKESILANKDSLSDKTVTEKDANGGTRDTSEYQKEQDYVILDDGYNQPYVTKSICPKAQGVVVLAQGGEDVIVVEKITKAVESLLDIPIHKIQVYKLSN